MTQGPFQPFRLVMSNGLSYEVRRPDMAFSTRASLLVGIDESDDAVPENFKICSLLRVTAIEPMNSSPAEPKSSGSA